MALLSAGCETPAPRTGFVEAVQQSNLSESQAETIAVDLISILLQLPNSAPFYTTIQFSPPSNLFGEELITAASDSGYGVQMVDADQGANHMNYRLSPATSDGLRTMDVSIAIGNIEISREYFTSATRIYPTSEIRVRGVPPRKLLVSNDIFPSSAKSRKIPTGVIFFDKNGSIAANYKTVEKTRVGSFVSGPDIMAARHLVMARAAIFTGERLSRAVSWRDELDSYRSHQVAKLRFKSRNLDLGQKNKKAVSALLDRFDSASDLLVITGCSFGKSLIWDGTEVASLDRSQRIKEELLVRGVRNNRIREEGCFQTEYGEELLPRMVILTLKKPAGIQL